MRSQMAWEMMKSFNKHNPGLANLITLKCAENAKKNPEGVNSSEWIKRADEMRVSMQDTRMATEDEPAM